MTISAFISGLILMLTSVLAYRATRDKIHPAVVFPFVWACTLVIVAFLPLIDFYPVNGYALLIFVMGGMFFSVVSIVMHYLFAKRFSTPNVTVVGVQSLNFLVFILFFTNLVVFYFAYNDFMALGSNMAQSAYIARQKTVQGEQVFSSLITNYLMLGLVVIPILTISLIGKALKIIPYLIISIPWVVLILLISGRSSLIGLILALLFIYYLTTRKVSIKLIVYIVSVFIVVMVAGALSVNKVQVSDNEGIGEIIVAFIQHIAAYAFQGPVLFSQFFDGNATLAPNWSPFTSIQHILSSIGLSQPPPRINLEFNRYGSELDMVGNVYSLYFSLYPHNGIFGALVVLMFYSMSSTFIYFRAKQGELIYVLLSGYIFSATMLSIFSDRFLPSTWFFIKLIIIVFFIKLVNQLGSRLHSFKNT